MAVVVLNSLTVFEYGDVKVTRGEAYEDGNVYEVQEDIAPCFECEHDFVNGTVQKHEKIVPADVKCIFMMWFIAYCAGICRRIYCVYILRLKRKKRENSRKEF